MSAPLFLVPSNWDEWERWLRDEAVDVAIIITVLGAVNWVVRRFLGRLLLRSAITAARRHGEPMGGRERRLRTVLSTFNWALTFFLVFVGVALVLDRLGVNVTALVAGIGIAGLAVGLGAQTLIKDVINGTLILVEEQYSVGDVVEVAGVRGIVTDVNPRRTVLRDLDGNVHTIPNSEIRVATNMTAGVSKVNLDLVLDFDEDVRRVTQIVDAVGAELAAARRDEVSVPPRVLRVQALTLDGVVLRVSGDVPAGKQWEVAGDLRQRLKERFDREGVRLARSSTGDRTQHPP